MLKRLFIPSVMLLLMIALYLLISGAPIRVHILSIGCLLVGFYLPSILAFNVKGLLKHWLMVSICMVASMLIFDATNHYVVYSVEPMMIFNNTPWLYPLGYIGLSLLIGISCYIARYLPEQKRMHDNS
jgi:hypothetical protein